MQWPRVKTILILLMFVVNAVLLGVLLSRRESDKNVTVNSVTDLVSVLNSQGVSMEPSAVPVDSTRIYTLETFRDEAFERSVSGYLLKDASVEDQGGNIYVYTGKNGKATFRGGGNLEIILSEPFETETGKTAAETASLLLSRMGFNLDNAGIEAKETDAGSTVSIRQSISGLPVFNSKVEVYLNGGMKFTGMSGRWTSGTPVRSDTEASKSAAYALLNITEAMDVSETPFKSITEMELGYITSAAAPGYLRILPVWRVKADGAEYYVNAMTGELEILG